MRWDWASVRLASSLATVASFGCAVDSNTPTDAERLATASSAIVGGVASTAAEDFIVYITGEYDGRDDCGAAVVAPNLLLTAKHCLKLFDRATKSKCDGTGEPVIGSAGGYATGNVPATEFIVYPGVDGRRRFLNKEPPAARGKTIIDDGTPTFCSHDLAFVVLDTPLTDVPIARLRLGKRPDAFPDLKLAIAGWGSAESGFPYNGAPTPTRLRRGGITIRRVGAPTLDPNATGDLGPRTFEAGPGGCTGDSGSPGFDEQTGGVLGILVRALNTDSSNPVSPCASDSVSNVYMTITDFDKLVREVFATAGASPWIEGKDAPGWAKFNETCTGNLECESGLCAGSRCNVDCAKGAQTCPAGYVCGPSGACETPAPDTQAPDASSATSSPAIDEAASSSDGCTAGSHPLRGDGMSPLVFVAFLACVAGTRRIASRARS
jgi:hypothetical protein